MSSVLLDSYLDSKKKAFLEVCYDKQTHSDLHLFFLCSGLSLNRGAMHSPWWWCHSMIHWELKQLRTS